MIESLSGDADLSGTGKITALDLKKHIDDNFLSYAKRYNKIQQGDVFTSSGGDSIIICEAQQLVPEFNYEITFKRNSNITLLGKDTGIIKTGDVVLDEKWKCTLEKGLNMIIDNNSGEQKLIANYSKKTISYDEF